MRSFYKLLFQMMLMTTLNTGSTVGSSANYVTFMRAYLVARGKKLGKSNRGRNKFPMLR